QRSPDPDWNNSSLNYWGTADLVNGSGAQRGYFANQHPDGSRDVGTFEGGIISSGSEVTLEGKFTFTGGTGKLLGIRGGGTYKGRITSPTTLEMSWSCQYVAAAGQAAYPPNFSTDSANTDSAEKAPARRLFCRGRWRNCGAGLQVGGPAVPEGSSFGPGPR